MKVLKSKTKNMTKMMKKMTVGGKLRRNLNDSSDESDEEMEANEDDMKLMAKSKKIKKKGFAYFKDLKKNLRR